MNLKVINTNYNRNGISGEGFMKVLFTCEEEGVTQTLIAVMPLDHVGEYVAERCYVINPIEFKECYHGDRIGHKLIPLVMEATK